MSTVRMDAGLHEQQLLGDAAALRQHHHLEHGLIMLRLLGTIDLSRTDDIPKLDAWKRDWHPAKYFKSFHSFRQETEHSFDVWIALRMDNDQWHQDRHLAGPQILPIAERAQRVTKWLNASQFLLTEQGRRGGAIELNRIKPSMHKDVISSFWTMMSELESQAFSDNDRTLMVQVEGWFRQWNRMTGDFKKPRWLK